MKLHTVPDSNSRQQHCRAMSSDDDSICEAEQELKNKHKQPLSLPGERQSSGYSSVQSVSPNSICASLPFMPCTFKSFRTSLGSTSANAQPGFRLLVPMQRPRGISSKQVKRKNKAAHSGGEVDRMDDNEEGESIGFLSL